ncbi:MAG TPA: ATP-binding protein [Candidatus Cybelea sp.]|nr:ATP-binding protein [Candidatus Cybelea sp.]
MTGSPTAVGAPLPSRESNLPEAASGRLRLDSNGRWRIAAASDRFLQLIGRSREEVVGTHATDILGLAESTLDEAAQSGTSAVEIEVVPRVRQVRVMLVPLPALPGGETEVLALLSGSPTIGTTGTSAPLPDPDAPHDLFVRYRTDLTVVACSERYASLYGSTPSELIGRNLAEWVSPDILLKIRQAVGRVARQDIINTHEADRRFPDGTVRSYRWIEITAPARVGQPAEIIAIGVDLTALNQTKARLHDAIESINEGFCLFDSNEKLVLVNQRFRDMYLNAGSVMREGMGFEEIVQLCAARGDLGPLDDPASVTAELMEQFRTLPLVQYQRQLGDGRWILLSHKRTSDGGFVGLRTDITAVKQNEEALQRASDELERKNAELVALAEELRAARALAEDSNRAKSRFLAHMSHELRTPLNSIIGFTDIMMGELFGPIQPSRYREYVELIQNSGKLLLSLINDVLDMSKIEAGKMELHIEPIEVQPLAESCRAMIVGMARDTSVAMRVEIEDGCTVLHADGRAVRQMIINLMSNAVKFTPAGGVVTLRFRSLGPTGVAIAVEDTGIGMTPAELEKAVQPFGQVDSELARQRTGTGIGLTLVKSLAELHGGTLELASEKGRGTTATIILPWHVDQ